VRVGYFDDDGGRINAMDYATRGRERPRRWFASSLTPARDRCTSSLSDLAQPSN
jgi:hypothetical protein